MGSFGMAVKNLSPFPFGRTVMWSQPILLHSRSQALLAFSCCEIGAQPPMMRKKMAILTDTSGMLDLSNCLEYEPE